MSILISALEWRYAVKKMNGTAVPPEKIERILDAMRLSPSSMGVQPYSVVVVSDPELRKQILPVAMNQQQVIDCSHLLVFAAWDNITAERSHDFLQDHATVRNQPLESFGYYKGVMDSLMTRSAEENFNWAARQAYIAFGIAIAAAAEQGVDATPMEGFTGPELDKLLGLDKQGLRSVTILPLGYRDPENDWLVNLPKVRREKSKLVIRK
ncbi:MAG: nitroreductase family protein [Chitinophagaceae bacterium]